jgi:hypothetical protein
LQPEREHLNQRYKDVLSPCQKSAISAAPGAGIMFGVWMHSICLEVERWMATGPERQGAHKQLDHPAW